MNNIADNKNVKKGKLLKRAYNRTIGAVVRRFRKEKEIQTPETKLNGPTEGQTESKGLAQEKETNGAQNDEEYGLKFVTCFLNDIERGEGRLADVIFSEEFKDAIINMEAYTPFETNLCGTQKQYLFRRILGQRIAGGDYQDPSLIKDIEKHRKDLVKKLNKRREGIRQLEKRDVDVILTTLANRMEWLEQLYNEVLNFGIKTNNENPGEVIGGTLSYLANTPTLIPKAGCHGCLIQKEKIVKIMDKKINEKAIKETANYYINQMIEIDDAGLAKGDDAPKEKTATELVRLVGGILVEENGEKKTTLEKRLLFSIEAHNSAAQNKKMTAKELEDSFKTYETLSKIENILEEAQQLNHTNPTINDAKAKIEEAVGIWSSGLKESISERIKIVEGRAYVLWTRYCNEKGIRKLADGVNEANKAIEGLNTSNSSKPDRETLQRMIKIAAVEINALKLQLYPPIFIIDRIKSTLSKKDDGVLSRLDLLKARTKIRGMPISLEQLKDGLPMEEQKWYMRWAVHIRKTAYNWFHWFGLVAVCKIAFAVLWMAAKTLGLTAIIRNWHLRYPHTMYSAEIKGRKIGLSRRTGVIINTLLTRAIGGWLALWLFAGLSPFRDTWVEDAAIAVKARPMYVKLKTKQRQGEDGVVLNVVWIDNEGNTRKIRESDIKERYGVQEKENIEFLMSEPEVLAYLDELVRGERTTIENKGTTKEGRYRLNKKTADILVTKIRDEHKEWLKPEDYKQMTVRKWLILSGKRPVIPLEKVEKKHVSFLNDKLIYPAKIDSYVKKYSLGVGAAEELSKLAAQNSDLFRLLTKGAAEWHIKDAAKFLAVHKNKADENNIKPTTKILVLPPQDGQQIAADLGEDTIVILENAEYIERSIDTFKEIGISYTDLNEKNLDYLVKMKKGEKIEVIRAILEMINKNNYVNNGKHDELIEALEDEITNAHTNIEMIVRQEEIGNRGAQITYVKGGLYDYFVEQLKDNKIITPRGNTSEQKEVEIDEKVVISREGWRASKTAGATTMEPKTPRGIKAVGPPRPPAHPSAPKPKNAATKPKTPATKNDGDKEKPAPEEKNKEPQKGSEGGDEATGSEEGDEEGVI